MTRKDYIRIARALRLAAEHEIRSNTAWAASGVKSAAEFIANELGDDNPRFNREHFMAVVNGEKNLDSRPPRQVAA